ncbi:hypothetical protein AYO38_01090 [bacterium SCGC AG-212-C10]|nr:hypothetical protein AYO38_01090 [bacterium SCGC AG-212-C10]
MVAIACGGGGDDDAPTATATVPSPAATTASSAAGTTATALPAASLTRQAMPDLKALGYNLDAQERDPAAPVGQDVYRARFSNPAGGQVLIVLYYFPDEGTAAAQFTSLSEALKNPPPNFVGGNAQFNASQPPALGEQQKGYITAQSDSKGNRVWSDVYRFQKYVAVVQYLDKGQGDQLEGRAAIASAIQSKAK